MGIRKHEPLEGYSTFRIGKSAAYFAELRSVEDIEAFNRFAKNKNLPLLLLGGGSNVVFPDHELGACVGKMEMRGFEVLSEDNSHAVIKIGAGEVWDLAVERAVLMNLSGVEALSAIPGTAGATPVQNVGAYGQEIADTLIELEAFDLKENKLVSLSKLDCGFSYRDSKFKNEWKGRFAIVSITLSLSKTKPPIPNYPGVEAYFAKQGITSPTLKEIRAAIIEIRKHKLPDPREIASCGSFFKNPIVPERMAQEINARYPNMPAFPAGEGKQKLAAGWLIEQAGFKGKSFGRIGVYEHNALVLVNLGGATRQELDEVVERIEKTVLARFGVALQPEVVRLS